VNNLRFILWVCPGLIEEILKNIYKSSELWVLDSFSKCRINTQLIVIQVSQKSCIYIEFMRNNTGFKLKYISHKMRGLFAVIKRFVEVNMNSTALTNYYLP